MKSRNRTLQSLSALAAFSFAGTPSQAAVVLADDFADRSLSGNTTTVTATVDPAGTATDKLFVDVEVTQN